jgi:ATP-dependent helicase HrpA
MTASLGQLERDLECALRWDRFRLRRQLRSLRPDSREERLERIAADLRRSIALRGARQAGVPRVSYDEQLPVAWRREEIARAIRDHQVVIVCGETGSGKSTQLPKICLELGRGVDGMIGHTQPRRIAARSVAARVAEELGTSLGQGVGFQVRFAEAMSDRTYVKLMTDGILLAELQSDPYLDHYDTIIVDEAHERSLNIDFLLGYLKQLSAKRQDLKIIITSATIDAARFSEHFAGEQGPAPIVEVSGRTYPVEVRWQPVESDDAEPDWIEAALRVVDELACIDGGDMLIFMPTERDIHETAKSLRGRTLPGDTSDRRTEIMPLYARLSVAEQQRVFQPHTHRRIVIATNVAESSLTVPGIRYVIDPGTARISRYSARSKTQRLPIEPISRASADQRKGRCGRVGPGICVRLYSEEDYERRERYTPPEIQRTNLASVILQMKAFRFGEIETFPFLDPPRPETIRDGYRTLFELGAIDDQQELTAVGRQLSRLPVDPRIGRMILAAKEEGCLHELLIIAAVLELQDPRERPLDKQEEADRLHGRFVAEDSDFLSYLKLWDYYQDLKRQLTRNQLRKACRQNFLSYNRMREWADIHLELVRLVQRAGFSIGTRRDHAGPIHRAILGGLLSNVAVRSDRYMYTTAASGKFQVWPGSAVFDSRPRWIVAAELVETTRRYLRVCARINRQWIESLAPHLLRRFYSDLRWESGVSAAVATERVTLLDLTIVPKRFVQYGPIDPQVARELLIEFGLVEALLHPRPEFLSHNEELRKSMEYLQAKLRRSDMLVDRWGRYRFYDRRIPRDVFDGATLKRWLRRAQHRDPRVLWMAKSDLVAPDTPEVDPSAFPDTLMIPSAGMELPLTYRFELGSPDDGVTLTVPVEALGRLDPEQLDWLVPGLLEPKVLAMIRLLPKEMRRSLVPAPDTAKVVCQRLRFGRGNFRELLAAELSHAAGQAISPRAFDSERIPADLTMNLRVVAADGKILAEGRDLDELRRRLGVEVARTLAAVEDTEWNRDGLHAWDFDVLPREVEVRRNGLVLKAFPAMIDQGDAVGLRLVDSRERADEQTRSAVRRLVIFASRRELNMHVAWLPNLDKMRLCSAAIPRLNLEEDLAELIADRAFVADRPLPRSREEFEAWLAAGREQLPSAVQDVVKTVTPLWEAYHQARVAVEEAVAPTLRHAVADIRSQMAELTSPGFLTATPWDWLRQYPRYFRAMIVRLDRVAGGNRDRDMDFAEELRFRWDAYVERLRDHCQRGVFDAGLVQYRWMLEEYRVSLFAQRLGTAVPVSATRLDRVWEGIRT